MGKMPPPCGYLTSSLSLARMIYFLAVVTAFVAFSAHALDAVTVAATPRMVDMQGGIEWSDRRVLTANPYWYKCGDLGTTCHSRPKSSVGWHVFSGNAGFANPGHIGAVCALNTSVSEVTRAAASLLESLPTVAARRVSDTRFEQWLITGNLWTCDGERWAFVNGSESGPVPAPLSCVIEAVPEIHLEMETGQRDVDANARVVCKGKGRTTAQIRVIGASEATPIRGLTVSTKIPTGTFTVSAGGSKPVDISVTVAANRPAPGRYHASFVYVLEFI